MNRVSSLVLVSLLGASTVRAGDVPDWLQQAARAELPAYEAGVPAVVIYDRGRIVVDANGRRVQTLAFALKILSREGRRRAEARAVYTPDTAKVRDLNAWIVRPSGDSTHLGKSAVVDVAVSGNDVYNEARVRVIDASDEIQPGEVFGFESVIEQQAEFNQLVWSFQGRLPVRLSRCELTLPPGWTVKDTWLNHARLEPQLAGSTYAWELRDLAYLAPEPASPDPAGLAPRLALSLLPPVSAAGGLRSFASWQDVARWTSGLHDARAQPDPSVTARAHELTQGRTDELARVQALARFVQRLPYISIQVGIGRFQPHAAAEILAKSYGDCKDKATLLRSLLSVAGIASYPVLVAAEDPRFVRPEWPSPLQFDHVILAIGTTAAAGSPAAVTHPTLGPLLLFDPTDEHSRLGDLPQREQGGAALLAAGDAGWLFTVPTIPPEANHLSRDTRAQLSATGQLSGRLVEKSVGQAAAEERAVYSGRARSDYVSLIERWLARGITGVKATRVEVADDDQGSFRLEVEFATEHYGQSMQGRLMIFKPALVSRRQSVQLTQPQRKQPVIVESLAYDETAHVALPAGFGVDELPAPVELTTSFGDYRLKVETRGDEVILTRRLTTRAAIVPVEQYASVRGFYEKIMAAEQAPVVLVRK
jgi:hypothetical protein